MSKPRKKAKAADATSANVGYEAQLWQMADALRGNMDAAEYKHVVLGLIFLKYISDAFEVFGRERSVITKHAYGYHASEVKRCCP